MSENKIKILFVKFLFFARDGLVFKFPPVARNAKKAMLKEFFFQERESTKVFIELQIKIKWFFEKGCGPL